MRKRIKRVKKKSFIKIKPKKIFKPKVRNKNYFDDNEFY